MNLTVRELKKVLKLFPDDATVEAYEGEGIGLRVEYKGKYGWIDTYASEYGRLEHEPLEEF